MLTFECIKYSLIPEVQFRASPGGCGEAWPLGGVVVSALPSLPWQHGGVYVRRSAKFDAKEMRRKLQRYTSSGTPVRPRARSVPARPIRVLVSGFEESGRSFWK